MHLCVMLIFGGRHQDTKNARTVIIHASKALRIACQPR